MGAIKFYFINLHIEKKQIQKVTQMITNKYWLVMEFSLGIIWVSTNVDSFLKNLNFRTKTQDGNFSWRCQRYHRTQFLHMHEHVDAAVWATTHQIVGRRIFQFCCFFTLFFHKIINEKYVGLKCVHSRLTIFILP